MATFHVSWYIANTVGQTATKVKYRIKGTSLWSSFLVEPSGTTATFPADDNRIYDVQFQNINNADNPLSTIVNSIGISDPNPTLSPTNISVGYQFDNLSEDIDSYTVQIALYTTPGTIIATNIETPAEPVIGSFPDLTPLTQYNLYITPVAEQFYKTFTYTFVTNGVGSCASPQNISATLS